MDYLLNGFLIFIARACDVSLGTIRIVLLAKGIKTLGNAEGREGAKKLSSSFLYYRSIIEVKIQ